MKCKNCDNELHYGSKYCNVCGEKIPKETYAEDYKRTIWGKFDKFYDWYLTATLKKITGHIVFKIVVLAAISIFILFQLYGAYGKITLEKSEFYKVVYNKTEDEYYIETDEMSVNLNMSVPIATKQVVVSGVNGEKVEKKEISIDEYKSEGVLIEKDKYEYITVDAVKDGKHIDGVKVIVSSEGYDE